MRAFSLLMWKPDWSMHSLSCAFGMVLWLGAGLAMNKWAAKTDLAFATLYQHLDPGEYMN